MCLRCEPRWRGSCRRGTGLCLTAPLLLLLVLIWVTVLKLLLVAIVAVMLTLDWPTGEVEVRVKGRKERGVQVTLPLGARGRERREWRGPGRQGKKVPQMRCREDLRQAQLSRQHQHRCLGTRQRQAWVPPRQGVAVMQMQ